MAGESVIFDGKQTEEFLGQLEKRVKEVSEKSNQFIGVLSAVVFRDVMYHFQAEMGSGGVWNKWSQAYREHMERIGKESNNILEDTGRLRGSFQPGQYRRVSDGVIWFNNAKTKDGFPYAAAHDEGGGKLPKRDFMWLSVGAKEAIETVTLDHILKDV